MHKLSTGCVHLNAPKCCEIIYENSPNASVRFMYVIEIVLTGALINAVLCDVWYIGIVIGMVCW